MVSVVVADFVFGWVVHSGVGYLYISVARRDLWMVLQLSNGGCAGDLSEKYLECEL